MTTQVTVKTHGHPVQVSISARHDFSSDTVRSFGYSERTEFVAKGTEATFSVSDTTTVSVTELPADAEGLSSPSDRATVCVNTAG